jgi:lysophospholipase L1-like esterase
MSDRLQFVSQPYKLDLVGHLAFSMRQPKSAAKVPRSSMSAQRLRLYRIGMLAASLLFSLAVVEAGLRILEKRRLGDRAVEQRLVPDPDLGTRLAPGTASHDANGFRNDMVPARADIVAIGDSLTYGVNADRQGCWPQQLAKLSGRSVYNMSVPGYGPVQYWMLTERAQKFSPRIIIVGLYLGNDLYDAYALTYSNERYAELRSKPASDPLMIDTIGTTAKSYWDEGTNFHNSYGRSSPAGWSFWLQEHSAVGRLLNRAGLWPGAADVDYEIDKAWANAYPEHGAVYEKGNTLTVFTTATRLMGLNFNDPRIAEGLRISKLVLGRMRRDAEAGHSRLMVVLLPTKETVYANALKDRLNVGTTFATLLAMESRAHSELMSSCGEQQIECVDALPALSAAISRDEKIYSSTREGHPNAKGYATIAAAINQAIERLGW